MTNRLNELIGFVAVIFIGLLLVAPPLGVLAIGFVLPFLIPLLLTLAVLGAFVFNIRDWLERKLEDRLNSIEGTAHALRATHPRPEIPAPADPP